MALKDWKKIVIADDNSSLWIDFHNERRGVTPMALQSTNNREEFSLYIYGGRIPIERKFKSEKSALASAEKYMRTH